MKETLIKVLLTSRIISESPVLLAMLTALGLAGLIALGLFLARIILL